eukprot:c13630_g1_i1.p1 GENE.c13630_g1_i1~~c13630_g1_i1.p1  ORF type:complete len:502 (+),score=124.13 c13630_g1_i1:35-1507(+)
MSKVQTFVSLCVLATLATFVYLTEKKALETRNSSHQNDTDSSNEKFEWTRPLFHNPIDDIFGTILALLTVIAGQAGGIGGGGLLVPMYLIVLKLDKFAIPLSKATIFGSAVTGVVMLARKRHPSSDRPLIAYDVALILEPLTLAGTIVGVLLNTIFPKWLITILLMILLSYTTKKTFLRGQKLWNQETAKRKAFDYKELAPEAPKDVEKSATPTQVAKQVAVLQNESPGQVMATRRSYVAPEDNGDVKELEAIHQRERSVPVFVIVVLVITWVIVLVSAFIKGGHGAPSVAGVKCGSLWFWLVSALAFSSTIAITIVCGIRLHKDFKHKEALHYEFKKGDVKWDYRNSLVYPTLCTLAGIAAGLLGIGGGMVKSPLMLEMGMLPEVTAATSIFMILFTSSSTTMQFLVLGMLRLDYSLWYGGVGMVGAYMGQIVTDMIIKKYGRASVVVFAVSLVTGLSALVMGVEGIIGAVSDVHHERWDQLAFHTLCH